MKIKLFLMGSIAIVVIAGTIMHTRGARRRSTPAARSQVANSLAPTAVPPVEFEQSSFCLKRKCKRLTDYVGNQYPPTQLRISGALTNEYSFDYTFDGQEDMTVGVESIEGHLSGFGVSFRGEDKLTSNDPNVLRDALELTKNPSGDAATMRYIATHADIQLCSTCSPADIKERAQDGLYRVTAGNSGNPVVIFIKNSSPRFTTHT